MIELPRSLAKHLIAHARDAAPHEACGVVGLRDNRVVTLRAANNKAANPTVRFEFGDHGFHVIMALEREGLDTGVYHSHPASPAYPSATDRREMKEGWPGVLQLMVSLAVDPPEINAYRIDQEGNVTAELLTLLD